MSHAGAPGLQEVLWVAARGYRRFRGDVASVDSEAHDPGSREALCRRCGRCCYHKLVVDDLVIALSDPCIHLDTDTHLCKVYENRFQINPGCLSVARGIPRRAFPEDCPYASNLTHYRGPIYGMSREEIGQLVGDGEIDS